MKRSRVKGSGKQEMSTSCTVSESSHLPISRQGSSLPDGTPTSKQIRAGLFRSYSETNLAVKRRSISKVLPELKVSCKYSDKNFSFYWIIVLANLRYANAFIDS